MGFTQFTATAPAYFADSTGFGGNITAGTDQPILTVSSNEDVLLVGFEKIQSRLIYSGNDIVPFNFFLINSEYGSGSTFSAITLDKGAFSIGGRGITVTSQTGTQRIDLDIPDQVFEFSLVNNGAERITAARDFINEWIYFSYPVNESIYKFPNQTLQYNYRDDSWAIFNESYTTYGQFREQSGLTWATVGNIYPTWEEWNVPWNASQTTLDQPDIIAGNSQGFVIVRDKGTGEAQSLCIGNISFPATITMATKANPVVLTANNQFVVGQQVSISGVLGMTQFNGNTYTISAVTSTTVTINVNGSGFSNYISGGLASPLESIYSPNHCLNDGDYIVLSGILGTAGGSLNGNIYSVQNPTTNGFTLNGTPQPTSGTYFGGGLIQRMYVPQNSKQAISDGLGDI